MDRSISFQSALQRPVGRLAGRNLIVPRALFGKKQAAKTQKKADIAP